MSGQIASDLQFEPPGPGSWNLDPVHFPRPVTRYFSDTHPEPFRRGVHEFMAYLGTLIDTMETHYVNGFAYNAMRPAPENEIPERFAWAEVVWEQRVWREQLREWDDTFKPAAIKTHRELQSVDAEALTDDELVAYLTRCRDHHANMMFQHMRFTGSAMLPVGDLLAHLGAWTDVTPADALSMMRGATPVSAGASGEHDRLVTAISQDADARGLSSAQRATPAKFSKNFVGSGAMSERPRRSISTSSGTGCSMASTSQVATPWSSPTSSCAPSDRQWTVQRAMMRVSTR